MSSLIDDLDSLIEQSSTIEKKCSVRVLLDNLDLDDSIKLSELIDTSTVSGAAISRMLNKNGHQINYSIINRHRRRNLGTGCSCP